MTTSAVNCIENITCRKCGWVLPATSRYCTSCGAPLKISVRAKHIAGSTLFYARVAVVTMIATLMTIFAMLEINYYMPWTAEARDSLTLAPSIQLSNNDVPANNIFESKLLANANFSTDDFAEMKNLIEKKVNEYLPPAVDNLLYERGWKIEFVAYGELPNPLAGYCNIITKIITVRPCASPTDVLFHEIGHAIDFECGFPSLARDFILASQEEPSWSSSLSTNMRVCQADVSSLQRFAQAFVHYALHPEDRDTAPRLYGWFDNNIF